VASKAVGWGPSAKDPATTTLRKAFPGKGDPIDINLSPKEKAAVGSIAIGTTTKKGERNERPSVFAPAPADVFSSSPKNIFRAASPKKAETEDSFKEETKSSVVLRREGKEVEIPLEKLVEAVIKQESSGNPKAVSNKGARGLMQLMPETARYVAGKLGEKYRPDDVAQNVRIGTKYLSMLKEMFNNDAELVLTAYHSGEGRVRDLLKKHKGKSLSDIRASLGPAGREYADSVIKRIKHG